MFKQGELLNMLHCTNHKPRRFAGKKVQVKCFLNKDSLGKTDHETVSFTKEVESRYHGKKRGETEKPHE